MILYLPCPRCAHDVLWQSIADEGKMTYCRKCKWSVVE